MESYDLIENSYYLRKCKDFLVWNICLLCRVSNVALDVMYFQLNNIVVKVSLLYKI